MTTYEVVLVARTPAVNGPPTLTVANRLVVDTISYTTELNRPGTATLGCPIRALSTDAKSRLSDIALNPSEVWIYADSAIVWAGELQSLSIQGQTVQLNCVGLLGYTFRMGVVTDLVYSGVDQFTIAKGLINQWQSLGYGNYGIDTSGVGLCGINRDRTYLQAELHNVGQRLTELGAVINGFDIAVDPTTRALILKQPRLGTDLSASVVFDQLNIDSADIAVSIAPDDLVSDVSCSGTASDLAGINTTLYSARSTPAVRAIYGRSWSGQNFNNVSEQTTLDGAGDAFLASRTQQMFQPGVTLVPRLFPDVTTFHPGDIVTYSYDAGLGFQTFTLRVAKLTIDVDSAGKARMKVEAV